MTNARPIPDGFHSITPYLIIRDAAAAMVFYSRAFGATEILRLRGPAGEVVHAEMRIGDSAIMVGEECAAWEAFSPPHFQGTPVTICLYVADVDAAFAQATAAGATVKRPLTDEFYGHRTAHLSDPFGHSWHLATRMEELTQEQMQRRMEDLMRHQGQQQQQQQQ